MTQLATWRQFLRCREEASFNAANPETANEWNQADEENGWIDIFDQIDQDGMQPKYPLIFPQGKSGSRAMHPAAPVAGALGAELGQIVTPVYPELIDRLLRGNLGTVTRTPTAGTAALSATLFASVATLDTQPGSEEVLKFTVASSTAASGASIDVIQNGVTVETVTFPDSASSIDGDYYMKLNVEDGTTNNVTFSVSGSITSGTVAISGIKYIEANHKVNAAGAASLVIEQAARVEVGSANSEFFPGCTVPTLNFAYDRSNVEALLLATATIRGLVPTTATSTTYQNDAIDAYKPFAAWTGAVQIDDSANYEVVQANIVLESGDEHFSVSSGSQSPYGVVEGRFAFTGTLTVIPQATTRWTDYTGATVRKLEIEFLTPFYVNGSTAYQFKFTANNCYIQDYTRTQQGMAQGATLAFVGVWNSTDSGPVQIDTRGRLPV